MGCDEGDWIGVAPDMIQCQAFVNTVLSLRISGKQEMLSLAWKI
jgi:hypothetical protein